MSKIYLITNDMNDKVYVGKTEFSIEKRFQEHCKDREKREEEKRPLYNAMNKYGIEHFSISLIEECSTEDAPVREQYWIEYYNSYSNGYNATLGGDGKAYIDRQHLYKLWQQGLMIKDIADLTGHDKTHISDLLKQMGITNEDIKYRTIRGRAYGACKQVEMLDKKTNEVILTFDSTRDAARYLIQTLSLNPKSESGYSSHISEVCNGKRKTCQGYKWRYSNL